MIKKKVENKWDLEVLKENKKRKEYQKEIPEKLLQHRQEMKENRR